MLCNKFGISILAAAAVTGTPVMIAAPTAHADALTCFVDVPVVERGQSEVHFGFKAHCTIYADTIKTETRLWRSDTSKGTPKQRGDMRPESFMLAQDLEKSYTEPCTAGAPTGYWYAEVKFIAKKGNAADTDTVVNTEAAPAISC